MKTPTRTNSWFVKKDLELLRYLRNMVDTKQSGSITMKNIYEDEPWTLNHVKNDLSKKNEWCYFVPRVKRGVKTAKRSVTGRGESEGGTWKRTGKIEEIVDGNKKVHGYKQSLVYHKKVKGEAEKTKWLMTEYSLHKDGDNEFQDLVLCQIGEKKEKKVNVVPQVENNIVLPNQEQQEVSSGNEIESKS